uniref:Uncharacterized protein n=1 Tax=Octopus bimaculoides TaxID=37653 RepID=A0A0L8FJY7_OCTBM
MEEKNSKIFIKQGGKLLVYVLQVKYVCSQFYFTQQLDLYCLLFSFGCYIRECVFIGNQYI